MLLARQPCMRGTRCTGADVSCSNNKVLGESADAAFTFCVPQAPADFTLPPSSLPLPPLPAPIPPPVTAVVSSPQVTHAAVTLANNATAALAAAVASPAAGPSPPRLPTAYAVATTANVVIVGRRRQWKS